MAMEEEKYAAIRKVEAEMKYAEQRKYVAHLVEQNEKLAQACEVYKRALVQALGESRGY